MAEEADAMKLMVTDNGVEAARPIRGIDHVLVGVRDLEAARETYARLGLPVSPPGRHIGSGTANYWLMFPGYYIELPGLVDAPPFTPNLTRFLAIRAAPLALPLLTPRDPPGVRCSP